MDRTPQTLLEAVTFFADPDRAHAVRRAMRWPNGSLARVRVADRRTCRSSPPARCGAAKSASGSSRSRVGTIFEDSPIPFSKWLPAFWLLSNTKNGTSSCELARALGVTQKTAWFMLHRIRETMGDAHVREENAGRGRG